MKLRNSSSPPIITLRWNEYKKRSTIERFPLSVLCGMLILTVSLGALYDLRMKRNATNEPISLGLYAIQENMTDEMEAS